MLYQLSYMGKVLSPAVVERVMGIEPTSSAWKAEVLPLNYTRLQPDARRFAVPRRCWWRGEDSNLRRLSRQIYSLIPLTAREPLRTKPSIIGVLVFIVK